MNKDKERHRQLIREHYQKNKLYYLYKAKKYRQGLREWYNELKSKYSCIKCSETYIRSLDFHHRDPSTKKMEVSQMVAHGYSKKSILEEIAKCDCLCSNCHRKLQPSPFQEGCEKNDTPSLVNVNQGLTFTFFELI